MAEITQLGRYQIESHLGSGAYADVYKAVDRILKRTVALKVLKPGFVSDEEAFARFTQEAQVASTLVHPRIAWVWDLGEADGRYFIAMRFVDGKGLDQLIQERGKFTWDEAVVYAAHVAEGLQLAHNQGLVHRDVKPSNIIVHPVDGAVLTDFGLVRAVEAGGGSLTRTGAMIGTPQYLAPEVWEGKTAGPESDQYALACVFVEMVSGVSPFSAPTPVAIMKKVFESVVLPKELDDWQITVLQKALSKDYLGRYSSVAEFISLISNPKKDFRGKNVIDLPTNIPTPRADEIVKSKNSSSDKKNHILNVESDSTQKDFTVFYTRGIECFHEKKFKTAFENFSLAIDIVKDNPEAYNKRGECLENLERYDEALADYGDAIRLYPEYSDAYLNRGSTYDSLGKFDLAVLDYTRAIQLNPKDDTAYNNRGVAYEKLGHASLAIADYSMAINLTQEPADILQNRGILYQGLGNYDLALQDFQTVINLVPSRSDIYLYRADCYYHLEEYEKAIADITVYMRDFDDDATAYLKRGDSYFCLENYDKALEDYKHGIKLDPTNKELYNSRGDAYYVVQKFSQAVKDYSKAIELDPDYWAAYSNRGFCFLSTGSYNEAIEDYSVAIEMNPQDPILFRNRGLCYDGIKEYDQAIADYSSAITLDSEDAESYNCRGLSLLQQKKSQLALDDFNQAIKINSQQGDFYKSRAQALRKLGKVEAAKKDELRAKQLDELLQDD